MSRVQPPQLSEIILFIMPLISDAVRFDVGDMLEHAMRRRGGFSTFMG